MLNKEIDEHNFKAFDLATEVHKLNVIWIDILVMQVAWQTLRLKEQ